MDAAKAAARTVVERQPPNVLIKIVGMQQPNFRLLHAARDTRVACEVESDQGILWMPVTRFEKDCLRFLDILGAPD